MLIFDFEKAYIGSVNLTGAGMGMKSCKRRNFEDGVLNDAPSLVDTVMELFYTVWRGAACSRCDRRQFCGDPIK